MSLIVPLSIKLPPFSIKPLDWMANTLISYNNQTYGERINKTMVWFKLYKENQVTDV